MSRLRSPWEEWPLGSEVTNGTQYGVIVRSDFIWEKTGDYIPMVRVTGGPIKKRFAWEKPNRWRVLTESEAERVQAERDERRMARDADEPASARWKGRSGYTTRYEPRTGSAVVVDAPPVSAEHRAVIDRGRVVGDDDLPY